MLGCGYERKKGEVFMNEVMRWYRGIGTVMVLGMLAAGPGWAEDAWYPEDLYAPQMGEEPALASAAAGIAAWAQQPQQGPDGRPLPLAGSWSTEHMFGPDRFVEMIEAGHHMILTFTDPNFVAMARHFSHGGGRPDIIDTYYRPGLEYARAHNLPIAIRGWNWDGRVIEWQDRRVRAGETIPLEERANVIVDGVPVNLHDPFGPVQAWRDWGNFWLGNPLMQEIQEIYPDPPMVLLLNNNEGPKVRNLNQIPEDYERFTALHGAGPHSDTDKMRAIRSGYQERFGALMEAARDALVEPAWRENTRFVAYNNLWDTGYIGQGGRPRPGIWFEPDEGWLEWRMFDGGMPELYDNDWQPGKTDHTPHSPQIEAMNYFGAQAWIFEQEPDYYWSAITWDGARMANVWRGRRWPTGFTSKPYRYVTEGQRWDFARYEGWVQFGLWATRPRSFHEFRFPAHAHHAYDEGTFMALVRSVDRPWDDATLRDFWRFGELVPNHAEAPWWTVDAQQPAWVRDLERWYLLTSDANPPRAQWRPDTQLRIFALALVQGEAPQRRWLVYAHAPLGAVADATVSVPGYGPIVLPSVSRAGCFYTLVEEGGMLAPLLVGGPWELTLTADQRFVEPGADVRFLAAPAHVPAAAALQRVSWHFGDGTSVEQDTFGPVTHAYDKAGEYLATVDARFADGTHVSEQVAVFVRSAPPPENVVYALSLRDAYAWEGPWADSGAPDHELVTYRHLPNAGSAPSPVVSGGRFVEDPDRGRVLELQGGDHEGIWLVRSEDTNMRADGHANRSFSLRFKAEALEGRQVLFAEGHVSLGFVLYLDGDTLYGGSFAGEAHYITHAGIEAGRWYEVTLALRDAGPAVADDKLHLYVDGSLVGRAPGMRVPMSYAPPRIGRGDLGGGANVHPRYHDDDAGRGTGRTFRGRLADFRMISD